VRPKPRLLDAPPAVDASPQELGDQVMGVVGNILEAAAVWYSLLYLVQIEGRDDLRDTFNRVTANLSSAFIWYIVYTTHKELTNVSERYFIDGVKIAEVPPEQYENHIKRERRIRGIPEPYQTAGGESLASAAIIHPPDAFAWLKKHDLLRDGPEYACRNMAILFGGMARLPPTVDHEMDAAVEMDRYDGLTGWFEAFNGDAWRAIADHGAEWQSPTEVVWVDQTFAVEHNNGNFLDKVKPRGDRRKKIGSEVYGTGHLSVYDYQTDFLQYLLNRNHDGDMDYVFGVAAGVDELFDMGIGFRQLYAEVGEPAGPLKTGDDLKPPFGFSGR